MEKEHVLDVLYKPLLHVWYYNVCVKSPPNQSAYGKRLEYFLEFVSRWGKCAI